MAGDVKNYPGGKPIVILGTDGADLYGITVDSSGHVQVDVLSNALPTGAATETSLASALTALQLIDDFALGTNKLFGFNARYAETGSDLAATVGNNHKDLGTVPAGELWVIQGVAGANATTAVQIVFNARSSSVICGFYKGTELAVAEWILWNGAIVLGPGDNLRISFVSCIAGDDLYWNAWGYKMKVS